MTIGPENASSVRVVEAAAGDEGQRIDNFLLRVLRGVPRGHVYRLLRRGEVRVNGGRVRPPYRLTTGDRVRLPPVRGERHAGGRLPAHLLDRLRDAIVHETDDVIVIDKPAGLAVHAGSGLGGGLIDGLRELRPDLPGLALVHRLDRDTSGCLLLAKRRTVQKELQLAMREAAFEKVYRAILVGDWAGPEARVDVALRRSVRRDNERIVHADPLGRPAVSHFRRLAATSRAGLTPVEVRLETGRTHQIRAHALHLGYPVLGDTKYGSRRRERAVLGWPTPRMFLHAHRLAFPLAGEIIRVESPVPPVFVDILRASR